MLRLDGWNELRTWNIWHNDGDGSGKRDEQNVSLPWKKEVMIGQLYLLI
jgi:hypothetical protein